MTLIAAIAALLTMQPPLYFERWLCSHRREVDGGELVVTRSVDVWGRAWADVVMWLPDRRGDRSVRWVRDGWIGSTALPWRLWTNLVGTRLVLSRAARRPVWLVVRVDGRSAGRRLLFRRMSDLEPSDRAQLEIWASLNSDEPGGGPVPDLTNAARIVLTAEEEGGAVLARRAFRLPRRALVQETIRRAAPMLAADAADYGARCRDTLGPPIMPEM